VHYLWPKPGAVRPSWKSTYLARATTPSGTVYAVAAGVYDAEPEKLFIEQMVEDAIVLIGKQGPAAFDAISRRDGEFFFHDVFVFVLDDKGVERANAGFSHLVGKNLLELPDFPARDLIRRELEFAKTQGPGWMIGEWPRVGETLPVREDIYLKSLSYGDETFVVGSGIYRE
jgi:hypothetical protein